MPFPHNSLYATIEHTLSLILARLQPNPTTLRVSDSLDRLLYLRFMNTRRSQIVSRLLTVRRIIAALLSWNELDWSGLSRGSILELAHDVNADRTREMSGWLDRIDRALAEVRALSPEGEFGLAEEDEEDEELENEHTEDDDEAISVRFPPHSVVLHRLGLMLPPPLADTPALASDRSNLASSSERRDPPTEPVSLDKPDANPSCTPRQSEGSSDIRVDVPSIPDCTDGSPPTPPTLAVTHPNLPLFFG